MLQPVETISRDDLEAVRVHYGARDFKAEIRGSRVIIEGATCSWASVLDDDVRLTLDAKVPGLRQEEIAPG